MASNYTWSFTTEAAPNTAPVANAGAGQTPYVNDTVTLNGSGSYDADGNLLTYSWSFTSTPSGNNATLNNPALVNPTFTVDVAGSYVISLTVNDGTVDSAADTVTISTLNSAPVANAGADQSAYVNDTVTLDGSGSTDADDNTLTYAWAFTSVPSGSNAALSDVTAVKPTFTVDKSGTYVVSLIVNDGTAVSQSDTVTISTINVAPVADAGIDQSVYVNDTVILNGSNSTDADGDVITYSWAFTTMPNGSSAALSDASAASPTFTADKAGTYVISLTVNDGTVNSQPDTVTITALNTTPVANAGQDQTVEEGDTVTLDGSGSSDADGDTLTYSWSFTTMPSGSSAVLSDSSAASPTFTADKAGTYVISLTVNDGTVDSQADTVTITAEEEPEDEDEIEAEVDIEPETINLKSKGTFKAFIELSSPYEESDIVLSTVECEGAEATEGKVDGSGRYIAKFNTQDVDVETESEKGEEMEFEVTGELSDGTRFRGSCDVKVKSDKEDKGK